MISRHAVLNIGLRASKEQMSRERFWTLDWNHRLAKPLQDFIIFLAKFCNIFTPTKVAAKLIIKRDGLS